MARVTVEDCLEREENRFALVVLAAARTRQIIHFNRPSHEVVEEWIDIALKLDP